MFKLFHYISASFEYIFLINKVSLQKAFFYFEIDVFWFIVNSDHLLNNRNLSPGANEAICGSSWCPHRRYHWEISSGNCSINVIFAWEHKNTCVKMKDKLWKQSVSLRTLKVWRKNVEVFSMFKRKARGHNKFKGENRRTGIRISIKLFKLSELNLGISN